MTCVMDFFLLIVLQNPFVALDARLQMHNISNVNLIYQKYNIYTN